MLLTPNVLECMYFTAKSSSEDKRTVINYEFDLYLENREISLDGVGYADTDRALIFRRPGQITSGRGNYDMYSLTLDFGGGAGDGSNIFRPVSGIPLPTCDFPELDTIPSVFRPRHFDELCEILEKLAECSYPNAADRTRQEQYIREFILLVLHDAARHARTDGSEAATNRHVKDACDYISKNFTGELTVGDIADHLHITENHLIKLFRRELGTTPNRYISELRLIHARYLLLHSDESVQQIAYSCGFNTPSYFTKRFEVRFGMLPNQLIKSKGALTEYGGRSDQHSRRKGTL